MRPGAPRLVVAAGARATEARLLADIGALLPASDAEVGLLSNPVIVVVPSRSLRVHLAARLVAVRDRAVAGVELATLHGLASGIVARCEAERETGRLLLPVLVSRFARREPALRELAASLEDGELPVIATVRDLLDAGLVPGAGDAFMELLGGHRDEAERERAAALVRIASAVALVLEAGDLQLEPGLLRRAAELLRAEPDRALPARAVLVHGFADATGAATDLIEALLRQRGARVYVDRPPDPADPSRADAGVVFGERFLGRLRGIATPESSAADSPPAAALAMFRAPGFHAEIREVARRIRTLLEGGARPERIGVAARDLGPYALAVQTGFARLAIPFSAPGATGSLDDAARRVRAVARLLRDGAQAPADTWLSAASGVAGFELRLALHTCGAARVRDVAVLEPDRVLDVNGQFALPIRRGLAELAAEDGDEGDEPVRVAPRRRLAGARLRHAVRRAAAFVALLDGWPADARPAEHLRRLRRLLDEGLGWRRRPPGAEVVAATLATLAAELPDGLALTRDEALMVVRRALEAAGAPPLGGAGGGVQVLSVTEARARTFGDLFVIGLNRDAFPRQVREDPLLPDRVRLSLAALLPDIPVKRTGFDEERFLFAQLLSSAERVTLSWLVCDDDGKARPPSPLVERLRLAAGGGEAPLVGTVFTPQPGELRPADEHAVLAGLHAPRAEFARRLETACGEAVGPQGAALAAARVAVLEELDPDRTSAAGRRRADQAGPYLGFVGAARERADPRVGTLAITTAENVAGCPWQAFLRRILRLEPSPDAMVAAAGVDASLLGQAVHRVLEATVTAAAGDLPRDVRDALAARPVPVRWPPQAEADRILRATVAALAREEGLAPPGVERLLEARVRPFLEAAQRMAWPEVGSTIGVLGVEASGSVTVEAPDGATRTVSFRADLVHEQDSRALFTDFKTGAPPSQGKQEATRRRHLLAAVRRGLLLQAVAYAQTAGARPADGRYAFLRPDLDDDVRVLAAAGGDEDLRAAFASALRAILDAWDSGSFFPRLEEAAGPEEPRRCAFCEVRDACVRGDSGARRRLARWARAAETGGGAHPRAEGALRRLWHLGVEAAGASPDGGGDG